MYAIIIFICFWSCLSAETRKSLIKHVTWGFEDYDLPDSDFRLDFNQDVEILKIEGYVSAAPLPDSSLFKPHYVRQNLLACRSGTSLPPGDVSLSKIPPNGEKERRYEQSLTSTPVEINVKQRGNVVVHFPISLQFMRNEFIVKSADGLFCHSDMKTYTGEWNNNSTQSVKGISEDPRESLDVEFHFRISYIDKGVEEI